MGFKVEVAGQVNWLMRDSETNMLSVIGSALVIGFSAFVSLLSLGLAITSITSICNHRFLVENGDIGGITVFLGITVLLGGATRAYIRYLHRAALRKREARVLRFLKSQSDGPLTIEDVSLNCSVSISEAVEVMNHLCINGACQSVLDEQGFIIYSLRNAPAGLTSAALIERDADPEFN